MPLGQAGREDRGLGRLWRVPSLEGAGCSYTEQGAKNRWGSTEIEKLIDFRKVGRGNTFVAGAWGNTTPNPEGLTTG